jgi:hypothetical protein
MSHLLDAYAPYAILALIIGLTAYPFIEMACTAITTRSTARQIRPNLRRSAP